MRRPLGARLFLPRRGVPLLSLFPCCSCCTNCESCCSCAWMLLMLGTVAGGCCCCCCCCCPALVGRGGGEEGVGRLRGARCSQVRFVVLSYTALLSLALSNLIRFLSCSLVLIFCLLSRKFRRAFSSTVGCSWRQAVRSWMARCISTLRR